MQMKKQTYCLNYIKITSFINLLIACSMHGITEIKQTGYPRGHLSVQGHNEVPRVTQGVGS